MIRITLFFAITLLGGLKAIAKTGDNLEITSLSDDVIVVTTQPYSVNSLLVRTKSGKVILVDTPMTPTHTFELLQWVKKKWGTYPHFAFNSHWHFDATGGNEVLEKYHVKIYASEKTNELLLKKGLSTAKSFSKDLKRIYPELAKEVALIQPTLASITLQSSSKAVVKIDGETIEMHFPGHTHSQDSIGIYFKQREILYGGCAIRTDKKLGNTDSANVKTWPKALEKYLKLPLKNVIPGHGKRFEPGLINETIELLNNHQAKK